VNSTKRTHITLATLESPRELLTFYSSVPFVPLTSVALTVPFVPLTTYQSLRKLCNITIPLGVWQASLTTYSSTTDIIIVIIFGPHWQTNANIDINFYNCFYFVWIACDCIWMNKLV